MAENGWEWRGSAPTRRRDRAPTRRRDRETTGQRDNETARQRDDETTGRRDNGKTQAFSVFPGVPRRSQSFPGVLSSTRQCVAVRGSAWPLGIRVVQMWCYPESWLDGGVLGRTSPFRQMRVVPQMTPYHKNCLASEWCRCGAIPKADWMGVYLGVHPHSGR